MVPIDRSSTVLTIILALIFLGEGITWIKLTAIAAISAGNMIPMISREGKNSNRSKSKAWLIYAVFSAVFASLTSILAKIGIENVESNLGAKAIRTCVVLIMAWIVVFVSGKTAYNQRHSQKELIFICLSGIATGASHGYVIIKRLGTEYPSVVVPY